MIVHRDLIHKILKDEEEHEDEKQKEIEKTTQQTKKVVVNVMLSAAQPKNVQTESQDSKFIKYKPSQQSAEEERIIRMLSESLYVAEQQASEDVTMRSKVEKEMMMKEKERKEQELCALARKARSERTGTGPTVGAGSGSFAHDASMMDTDEQMRPEHEQRNKRGNDRDWDPPRERFQREYPGRKT
ncbi:hypothetical protein L1987_32101 [Smallanthus sonchifolius]|uniref:Uncharacterized protein n=1 Tax=Smallanthus sonchifolius TaxID=185202 RepID=A0ACB9I8V6_9ASTR|nr:hypothetical protein L1987_32101 [Smallanthus sonchifolius]